MTEDPAAVERLNAVGVLTRREIEARILAPVIDALGKEFGRERVIEIVAEVVRSVARDQGRAMAASRGDRSLTGFAATLEPWTRDEAMRIEVRAQDADTLAFDVTRCRFAEMYRALGIPELGAVLSCNRDAALIEGFADDVQLTRTRTIMEGAACCDFRYARRRQRPEDGSEYRTPPSS
jgi:predicted ArsR family transcriptional regulator